MASKRSFPRDKETIFSQREAEKKRMDRWVLSVPSQSYQTKTDKDRQRQKRQTKTDKEEEVNDNHILTLSALLESRKNVIIPSGIFSKVLPLICLHFNTFASKVTQFPHHISISSSQVVSYQRCFLS